MAIPFTEFELERPIFYGCVCLCVCVCVQERERENEII